MSTLLAAAPPATAAEHLRLLLDSGWVIPLSGDGSRLDGDPIRLELPEAAQGVESMAIDFVQSRLYVIPVLLFDDRGAVVYDLRTLAKVGFLPGVSEVDIPVDRAAPHIVTVRRVDLDDRSESSSRAMSDRVRTILSKRVTEIRNRADPMQVLGSAEIGAIHARCYSVALGGFRTYTPDAWYDLQVVLRKASGPKTPEGLDAEDALGHVEDCWANGDLLRVRSDLNQRQGSFSFTAADVARQSLNGVVTHVDEPRHWRLPTHDSAFVALGQDSRYAAFLSGEVGTQLFDFQRGEAIPLAIGGNPFFAQESADGNEWYLPGVMATFRDDERMGMTTESSWTRTDKLFRLDVNGNPRSEEVALPNEITEVNRRNERRGTRGASEEEATPDPQVEELPLPPPGPVARRMTSVGIIGVIAD